MYSFPDVKSCNAMWQYCVEDLSSDGSDCVSPSTWCVYVSALFVIHILYHTTCTCHTLVTVKNFFTNRYQPRICRIVRSRVKRSPMPSYCTVGMQITIKQDPGRARQNN